MGCGVMLENNRESSRDDYERQGRTDRGWHHFMELGIRHDSRHLLKLVNASDERKTPA